MNRTSLIKPCLLSLLVFIMMPCLSLRAQSTGTPITTSPLTTANSTQPALSQTIKVTPLPQLMLLPWQTPMIDADTVYRTRKTRDAMTLQLKNALLPTAKLLDTVAPQNLTAEGARSQLKNIWAEERTTAVSSPTAIIPLWTHIHDYDLFALIVIDSMQNTIKSVTHRLVPRGKMRSALKDGSYTGYFAPTVLDLQSAVDLSGAQTPREDMSVGFRDQTASTRANEIDRNTIALLLAAQWSKDFTVINPFAVELLTTVHSFYRQANAMRRANRDVITRMTYTMPPSGLKLPVTLALNIRATDGVFGQTLPWFWSEPLTLGVNADQTINLIYSEKLKTSLNTEYASLRRNELPQVVKIRGAWAYVDKGRAWGLQMNDRLVSQDSPTGIKGHVVAYYGPEMKLSSARGWPIHEGAVVFIRKGQRDVRVGTTLTYDAMTVPTPWPPTTTSN
jgi:hypothetical protein